MPQNLNIAIVGVGNCASSLVQGIKYYENANSSHFVPGLMHVVLGGYHIRDINPVVGFDVDVRKVGEDISKAIYAPPNCTTRFADVPYLDAPVLMGPVMDGVSPHMQDFPEDKTFMVSDKNPINVVEALRDHQVNIVVNYLPVGSNKATKFYAEAALEAGCAFVNCIPSFIASDNDWATRFANANLPVLGDDVKSQLGATYLHRAILKAYFDRGIKIEETSQRNYGGNTDFANMTDPNRLAHKIKSKADSIQSLVGYDISKGFYAGPGDGALDNGYIEGQGDNKTAKIVVQGIGFGGIPLEVIVDLSVVDSPNSAGVAVDAIRCAGLALDRKIGGALLSPSAYFFKHPPEQLPDDQAQARLEQFILGTRER